MRVRLREMRVGIVTHQSLDATISIIEKWSECCIRHFSGLPNPKNCGFHFQTIQIPLISGGDDNGNAYRLINVLTLTEQYCIAFKNINCIPGYITNKILSSRISHYAVCISKPTHKVRYCSNSRV